MLANGPPPERWAGGKALVDGVREAAASSDFQQQLDALGRLPADAPPRQAARMLGNGITAVEAVPAALWAFLRHPGSFPDTVRSAIELGGDTDTIAAMAGALSGAFLGTNAIPTSWQQRLEVPHRLVDLADQLHARASRPLPTVPPD